MARREVIEVTCDRCTRTETQSPDSIPKKGATGPEASFKFHDQEVSYDDLCRRCRDSLGNYFSKIIKEKVEDEEASPVQVVKDDTPDKKCGLLNRLGKAATG